MNSMEKEFAHDVQKNNEWIQKNRIHDSENENRKENEKL